MKITVVTATYNCASTIGDCLRSVAGQTHPHIEHIVVDGASGDGTVDVLHRHASQLSRIISEPDNGIYDALNKGVANASGDIVGFLHADDLYADNKVLEDVAVAFQNPEVDAVYGDLTYVQKADTDKVVRYWRSSPFTRASLARGWMPPHPTLYLRRGVYERFGGFDLSYRIAADYDFMLRVLGAINGKVTYLPRVLVKMRLGGESNRSIHNVIRKSAEDLRALRSNGVGGLASLVLKNGSKLVQFVRRPS
ncbi:MAG: glycosyltransferase [Devosia sp.]|nr:glycosyltransferase [Devosia sp.]